MAKVVFHFLTATKYWKIEKNREITRKIRGQALKKIFSLVTKQPEEAAAAEEEQQQFSNFKDREFKPRGQKLNTFD